MDLGTQPLAE
jgi:hypothetical protein